MERQVRIYKNISDHEVFDPQLGVTIPAGERVNIASLYHMPPSKPEIVDITDKVDEYPELAPGGGQTNQEKKPDAAG